MRNWNTLNKIYLFILCAIVIATAIKIERYRGSSRYYFSGSVSVPRTYPIKVSNCHFMMANGEIGTVTYEDANDHRTASWGNGDFEETHEPQLLPVKLVIEYVSYRDQSFYKDTIDLPTVLMKTIFKNSEKERFRQRIYSPGGDVQGLNFVIGVANKGNVIIWLRGENYERVLLKHKIIPKEPTPDQTYYGRQMSKKEYLKEAFLYMSSEIIAGIVAGKDKDANYIDTPSNYVQPHLDH